MTATAPACTLAGVGVGLRQPHYEQALESRADLAFVEVHSENFFADGGVALEVLRRARELYPLSLHGVGLGLGSATGIDPWHLERLARLVRNVEPLRVSDHACFARTMTTQGTAPLHANDLLPVAFTVEALDLMVGNVAQVQDCLKRPILVENLSAYVSFVDDDMSETEFLVALCQRSGCSLLLDLNNLMVNALNTGAANPVEQCVSMMSRLPVPLIGEIHLAGYAQVDDLAVDDHGSTVRPAVWEVYRQALQRFGPVPTLIEWDTDLPAFPVLLGQARLAAHCLGALASPQAVAHT